MMYSQPDDTTLYGQVLDLDRTQQMSRPAGASALRITRPRSGPDRETIRQLACSLGLIGIGITAILCWSYVRISEPARTPAARVISRPTSPLPAFGSGLILVARPAQSPVVSIPTPWIAEQAPVGYPVCPPAPVPPSDSPGY